LVYYVQKLQGPKETAPADSTKATAPAAAPAPTTAAAHH
jgi:hypothetical protein